MANELNEQPDAEQEVRVTATAQPTPKEAEPAAIEVNDATSAISMNDMDNSPSPALRLVDNQNFKTFSYGDSEQPNPQNTGAKHEDQAQEAINAIRRDISLIAVGSSQISANQNLVSRQAGNDDAHISVRGRQELARQLAEQQRIAAWNAAQTMLGGVAMTNARALSTLQRINQDADRFIDKEIEAGRLQEKDREKVKEDLKKLEEGYSLKKEGKSLSAEQERGFSEAQNGAAGRIAAKEAQAMDKSYGYQETTTDFQTSTPKTQTETTSGFAAKADLKDLSFNQKPLFQSASALDIQDHFVQAGEATTPLDKKQAVPTPAVATAAPMTVATIQLKNDF